MRGKKHDVCHTCRQHKIGCDGSRPSCSQCQLMGRECRGYLQDLVIFQHKPASHRRRPGKKTISTGICDARPQSNSSLISDAVTSSASCDLKQLTYDECVALLVQHYIPKDEIPFLSHVEPSKSRICGGWVQALPHVSQEHEDFHRIVAPAVRALTMSMLVAGTGKQQEYLDTYGRALQGIRGVLNESTGSVGPTVAIAGMCLALSEVLVPTSTDGFKTHLRGVAAMMQSRGPRAFKDGVAHLMFVGVRPLIVLDAILRRKRTFLMDKSWRTIPFSVYPASGMQELLGHVTAIPPLLEAMNDKEANPQNLGDGFLDILSILQQWEDDFACKDVRYRSIHPSQLDIPIDAQLLPVPCFHFADVSHANSLTHCWAFRVVCLLQLSKLESRLPKQESTTCGELDRRADVSNLCMSICQGTPYLLQKEMSLYGSMSASFPLHMVSESLQTLQLENHDLVGWCAAIKEQIQSQRIALYEEMVEAGTFT